MSGAALEYFLLEADLGEGLAGPVTQSAIEYEAFGPYPTPIFQGRKKRPHSQTYFASILNRRYMC